MAERKLGDIRSYLKQMTSDVQLVPEVRVVRQVVELQLLKSAIKQKELYEPTIEAQIDQCIDGFIWLYVKGGTHDKIPDIVNTDAEAKEYYARFTEAWDRLQDYMRTNMHLLEE